MTNNAIYNEQIKQAMDKWGVSWFKFDEPSGNVTDSKGTAVGMIYSGATRVAGWNGEGYALNFNGSGDYVQFSDKVIYKGAKTIRFKIKTNGDQSAVVGILFENNSTVYEYGVYCSILGDGKIQFGIRQNNSLFTIDSTFSISDGNWHDVLFSFDGSKNVNGVKLYIDNSNNPNNTGQITFDELIEPSRNLVFGGHRDTSPYYFKGQVDDFQVYNKALSPSDFILNKTLILSNGEYKKWDVTNGWTTVSPTLPSVTQFLSDGMDSLPTPLDGLNDNFEVVTWADETNSTRALEMTAIPSPQFIAKATVSDIGGSLNGILTEDLSTYSTSSNVRFLLTNNNSTWYKWNGADFENVTYTNIDEILTLGNTYDELSSADYSKWTHSKINIGVFLKDDDNTTSKVNELGIITNSPINTSQVSDLNFYILNTTAKIELDLKGLWLSGQLSDLDLTRVQYRVFLNEQPYYPLSGQFTNLDNPPLNIDITFKSEEIKINDWNTLRVEFKDSFGTVDYWQTTFVGNYSSLMFMDVDGNYYSDDVGKVLQYLDFGTFFGGQYSVEHEVIVKNQYGYSVENLTIEANTGHLPDGVEVQFSDTNDPFTPQANLLLPNELKNEEQISFYIRMISDIDSVPNGENKFNIFVKAERKV